MKHKINTLNAGFGQLDRHHIQLALLVITLILFVIAGGAPEASGNCGSC